MIRNAESLKKKTKLIVKELMSKSKTPLFSDINIISLPLPSGPFNKKEMKTFEKWIVLSPALSAMGRWRRHDSPPNERAALQIVITHNNGIMY